MAHALDQHDDAWNAGREALGAALDEVLGRHARGGLLPENVSSTRFGQARAGIIAADAALALFDDCRASETGVRPVGSKSEVGKVLGVSPRHVELVFAIDWLKIAQEVADVLVREGAIEAPSALRWSTWVGEAARDGAYGVERRADGVLPLTVARLHLERAACAQVPAGWSMPFDETELITGTRWDRERARLSASHPTAPFPRTRIAHFAHLLRGFDAFARSRATAGDLTRRLPLIATQCRYPDDASGDPLLGDAAFGLGDGKLIDVLTRHDWPSVFECLVGCDGGLDPRDLVIDTRSQRRLRGDAALDALLACSGAVAPQVIDVALDGDDALGERLGIAPSVTVQVVREELYLAGRPRAIAIWRDPAGDMLRIAAHNLPIDVPRGRELLLRALNALWGGAQRELADCRRRFPSTFRVPFDVQSLDYEARRRVLGLGMAVNAGIVVAIVESRRVK